MAVRYLHRSEDALGASTDPEPKIIQIHYSYGPTHVYRKIIAVDGTLLASDSFRRGAGDPTAGTLKVVELGERDASVAV